MELPKRARTADWENGVLTLDGEKKFEIPELTMELMERLAGYTLVGLTMTLCIIPIICISWKSTLIMTVVSSIPQMHFIFIRIRCRIN